VSAESQYEDRVESVFIVRISTPEELEIVTADEVRKAIFRGVAIIDTEDAIEVVQQR